LCLRSHPPTTGDDTLFWNGLISPPDVASLKQSGSQVEFDAPMDPQPNLNAFGSPSLAYVVTTAQEWTATVAVLIDIPASPTGATSGIAVYQDEDGTPPFLVFGVSYWKDVPSVTLQVWKEKAYMTVKTPFKPILRRQWIWLRVRKTDLSFACSLIETGDDLLLAPCQNWGNEVTVNERDPEPKLRVGFLVRTEGEPVTTTFDSFQVVQCTTSETLR
jgi:hypothetical protein